MSLPEDKEKTDQRAGGRKKKMEKTRLFNMRVSPDYLETMGAAADALGLGKTKLVERALAAFCPEYFPDVGSGVSPESHPVKYAPQFFDGPKGQKKTRQRGGPADPEAKRKDDDSRGSREKFSDR